MRKPIKILALLTASTIGVGNASEWRTPWISEQGPIRYTMEKLHQGKRESNINLWTSSSVKAADKAFLKHGFTTKPMTALMFNEADFKLGGIFNNGQMARDSEFYNPYVNVVTFKPRATYMEYGLNIGGNIDYAVYGYKGRIGLRATVPFRYIQIQRDDTSDVLTDPLEDVHQSSYVVVSNKSDGQTAQQATQVQAEAWRLDFVEALNMADGSPLLCYNADAKNVTVAGSEITVDPKVDQTDKSPAIALVQSNQYATLPYYAWQWDATKTDGPTVVKDVVSVGTSATSNIAGIPATGTITTDSLNVLAKETDYAALLNAQESTTPNTLWLVGRYATDASTPSKRVQESNAIFNSIEFYSRAHSTNIFDFMANNDFVFETASRTGLGDCIADIFYEHTFSKSFIGEVSCGVKIPTGGNKDRGIYNPYKPQLGNGGHFEIRAGAALAWQPLGWMNTKFDAYYAVVLEAPECRTAVFENSKIKNIGPRADAEVDWGYFVGKVDFNFFHPKTDTIRSTLGYELYYKTEDRVNFKAAQLEQGWEGRKITQNSVTGVTNFSANPLTLDSKRARINTEAIGHRARFETSFQVMKYFEIFCGGSTTFAGQNVLCDHDAHGGFNIRF